MAEEEETQFHLKLNGIALEISGERKFVNSMYRQVMRDIEEARRRNSSVHEAETALHPRLSEEEVREQVRRSNHVVWIHRCGNLVHKIYMAGVSDFSQSPLFDYIDPERITTMFMEDRLLKKVLPNFENNQTLWAELTPAGKKKIAEARADDRHALDLELGLKQF